jgi:uncharacterized protein (TIGR02265 family)
MDTRDAVLRRIELAERQDARTHGQFLEETVAALTELFGAELAEEARGTVTRWSGTGSFNCPVSELLRLCDAGASAASLRVGIPYAEVLERLGVLANRAFLDSPLGKAFWRFPGRDPHDVLSLSAASARASTNYGERRYEKLGPSEALLLMRGDFMGPAWMLGFYGHGLQKLSNRPLSVTVEACREPGLDFNLRVSW